MKYMKKIALCMFFLLVSCEENTKFERGQQYLEKKMHQKGLNLLEQAIQEGNADAMAYMAHLYLQGKYVTSNFEKSYHYFKMAAEKNDADGLNNMGVSLMLGEGCKRNQALAVSCFKKASDQSWSEAEFNLGMCYYLGFGIQKNINDADYWFAKAQKRGIHNILDEKIPALVLKIKESMNSSGFFVRRWRDLGY
jgi:TPR repeat protein